MLHIATEKEICEGLTTDIYFQRTKEILEKEGGDAVVKAEVIAKKLPEDYSYAVLAGIEESLTIFDKCKINVRSMEEGTFIREYQPVMEIEGRYTDFGVYETAILGFLCQASGVATKAARCRKAAGNRGLLSFGARRMHPAIAPMIERNAYIGGCDGVSVIKSAELLGIKPTGTMPHALIILKGSTSQAALAFNRVIDKDVKRIILIDTFDDEKFETLRVAEALGKDLFGVRFDTPSSRRGDMLKILDEVRWELDLRGYNDVKLYVSGGIDEYKIEQLNLKADGYGVGTAISNAKVIDFSLDIVEVNGKPFAKKGKHSGAKKVFKCGRCGNTAVAPFTLENPICSCKTPMVNILKPLIENGGLVVNVPSPDMIRKKVLAEIEKM